MRLGHSLKSDYDWEMPHFHTADQLTVLFCLRIYVPVNSYGHVEIVISPNHTFFLGKLD